MLNRAHVCTTAIMVALISMLGCARRDDAAPVVRLPDAAGSPAELASSLVVATAVATTVAAPAPERLVQPGSCEARGLPQLDPCPQKLGTAPLDPDAVAEWEELQFCCGAGAAELGESEEPCFNALMMARACGDKAGETAVQLRIAESVHAYGEPCLRPRYRDKFTWSQRYQQICAERGYP